MCIIIWYNIQFIYQLHINYILFTFNWYKINKSNIYPGDQDAKTSIAREVLVSYRDEDSVYLRKVKAALIESISTYKPDFILYNAGTDCMQDDPLGCK